MGEVDLNRAEVTLLINGKKRIKRLDGSYDEAITLAKFAKVTLSDGTKYFAEVRIVPAEIIPLTPEADGVVYEHFFIEGYGVFNDDNGNVVHEKRGYI